MRFTFSTRRSIFTGYYSIWLGADVALARSDVAGARSRYGCVRCERRQIRSESDLNWNWSRNRTPRGSRRDTEGVTATDSSPAPCLCLPRLGSGPNPMHHTTSESYGSAALASSRRRDITPRPRRSTLRPHTSPTQPNQGHDAAGSRARAKAIATNPHRPRRLVRRRALAAPAAAASAAGVHLHLLLLPVA